jgi:ABC-type multidrug transport system ATPase subunit
LGLPGTQLDPVSGLPLIRTLGGPDPDIVAEKQRVHDRFQQRRINRQQDSIFIHEARKVYLARGTAPSKVAVKNVSLSIPHGEIFGLLGAASMHGDGLCVFCSIFYVDVFNRVCLGANGAGKTTLLKIVSGLEDPTKGDVCINGFDIKRYRSLAQRSMGLCPQFDTLVKRLTVYENLLLFGKIKGVPSDQLRGVCQALMDALRITRYSTKLVSKLSGGNRRKVSLAVALIGAPPTLYLDEPSTGLDPVASRLMWRLLNKIAAAKRQAIVLTTHNMLECEAVCSRIAIMKSGELVCMGNSQHLRSTHGTGYLLELVVESVDYVDAAKAFVQTAFPLSVICDEHACLLNYEISRECITKLSDTFRHLEEHKARLHIVDYSLSQSTLEQIFLKKIRPNQEALEDEEEAAAKALRPTYLDYFFGILSLFFALLVPGFHRCFLGDCWNGCFYFWTCNELFAGWLLDLCEIHILVQHAVQQFGHLTCRCCTWPFRCCYWAWYYLCCCCCWVRCCCCCCLRRGMEVDGGASLRTSAVYATPTLASDFSQGATSINPTVVLSSSASIDYAEKGVAMATIVQQPASAAGGSRKTAIGVRATGL